MDIVNGREEPKHTQADFYLETWIEKEKKKKDERYRHSGFQKLHVRGKSKDDKEFEERLKAHEKEIEDFYKKHPNEKRPKDGQGKYL